MERYYRVTVMSRMGDTLVDQIFTTTAMTKRSQVQELFKGAYTLADTIVVTLMDEKFVPGSGE